jgi:hypothetical protein
MKGKKMARVRDFLWAVVNSDGEVVSWKSMTDGEEGWEIHRTKKLAEGARMAGERVIKVRITRIA